MASGGAPLNLYAVLGVRSTASKEDISKAYRKLALKHHPDKTDESGRIAAAERFKNIARAYEVLRDDLRRWRYDETGDYDGAPESAYEVFFDSFFGDQARGSDGRSSDYTYYSLTNYDRLTLQEEDLPPYMRDIVKVGVHYLAQVLDDLDKREVAFLRHQRVDILYVMLAYFPPLNQDSFDGGYIIHYYDNPLQSAISASWSDQNVLGGGCSKRVSQAVRSLRSLNAEQFERRQEYARQALTTEVDPQMALEEKYAKPLVEQTATAIHDGGTSRSDACTASARAQQCCLPIAKFCFA
mmetsp:Transcript_50490/g.117870  ORF Transcript_50490/g.117870 Transcript_50490/m.117870 type:complete len:297 (+) Transcript_50490:33-923(+)